MEEQDFSEDTEMFQGSQNVNTNAKMEQGKCHGSRTILFTAESRASTFLLKIFLGKH